MLPCFQRRCGDRRPILLDEPTEGIQPSIIEEIVERMAALKAAGGLSPTLAEQSPGFIRARAQRVPIIQRGRIAQSVSPDQLATRS